MNRGRDGPRCPPTYQRDIVGDVRRWDERDTAFARTDLFRFFRPGSAQYQEYYRAHPEREAYDGAVWKALDLGKTGGVDKPMFEAQFDLGRMIAPEAFAKGLPQALAAGAAAGSRADIPPARASRKIKGLAKLLGADLVGIGPLDPRWVYAKVGRSAGDGQGYLKWGTPIDLSYHTNAIALGFRMDYGLMRCAPDFPVLLATARAYAEGAWVSVQIARYIAMLGYSARAHHFRNYQVLCVAVAVDCGLGELSRAGYLLTRKYGLGLRLAAVTTDLPLDQTHNLVPPDDGRPGKPQGGSSSPDGARPRPILRDVQGPSAARLS